MLKRDEYGFDLLSHRFEFVDRVSTLSEELLCLAEPFFFELVVVIAEQAFSEGRRAVA